MNQDDIIRAFEVGREYQCHLNGLYNSFSQIKHQLATIKAYSISNFEQEYASRIIEEEKNSLLEEIPKALKIYTRLTEMQRVYSAFIPLGVRENLQETLGSFLRFVKVLKKNELVANRRVLEDILDHTSEYNAFLKLETQATEKEIALT